MFTVVNSFRLNICWLFWSSKIVNVKCEYVVSGFSAGNVIIPSETSINKLLLDILADTGYMYVGSTTSPLKLFLYEETFTSRDLVTWLGVLKSFSLNV